MNEQQVALERQKIEALRNISMSLNGLGIVLSMVVVAIVFAT